MAILRVKDFVEQEYKKLSRMKRPEGIFHIFLFGDNPASKTYVRNKLSDAEKLGIKTMLHNYPVNVEFHVIANSINTLNNSRDTLGIMIQFPIPEQLKGIEQLVRSEYDVDGLAKNSCFEPCTPSGIIYYLEKGINCKLEGRDICIVGRSDLVGKPLQKMLNDRNATVTLCHSYTKNLKKHTLNSDIVITAIGKPKYFDSTFFKSGSLVIDVGINFDSEGKLCGDVDSKSIDQTNYMRKVPIDVTAVPGGVGLLTRLSLMRHCFGLDKK